MSKWITFENTQANFTLISLKTFEVLHQTSSYLQGSCRDISWWCLQNYVKSVENWLRYQQKLGKNNDKNAQRSVNTHCRQWVCGYCDCLGISFFFRLTTSDVRIRRQKSPNSENRVFHISLNKGYIGKAIISRSFSARYHILKKKKKKIYWVYVAIVLVNTLLLLATCPVSLNCSVTHEQRGALTQCCFNDGPHFQRSGDVETVLFQCITLITFGILYQTSPNLQGSRRNGCEWCVQKYMWSDWELTEISIKNATAGLVQCWLSVLH